MLTVRQNVHRFIPDEITAPGLFFICSLFLTRICYLMCDIMNGSSMWLADVICTLVKHEVISEEQVPFSCIMKDSLGW